ncbi:MAG: hypothetical protein Kow0031_27660 [Anaerolineae bacterium]
MSFSNQPASQPALPFFTRYAAQRRACWPAVEQFFSGLPPTQFRQGAQLKTHLAIHAGPSGHFADILSRPQDHPLLALPLWLLDDLPPAAPHQANAVAPHLLAASALAFAEKRLRRDISRPDTPFDAAFLPLAGQLDRAVESHLSTLFPPESHFWPHFRAARQEQPAAKTTLSPLDDGWQTLAAPWGIAKIPVAAAVLLGPRPDALPPLLTLTDHINLIFSLLEQLADFRRDLYAGRTSAVIGLVRAEAGINPEQPADPQRLLGALLVTPAVPRLIAHLQAHRAAAHGIAAGLPLPTLAGYLAELQPLLAEVQTALSLAGGGQPPATLHLPFFAPVGHAPAAARQAAEAFLLSDPTFRESWEVQRGLSGVPELTARAFPVGLLAEALGRAGVALPQTVADVFAWARQSRWRYYDNHPTLPPDADLLGLLLRLHRFAAFADRPRLAGELSEPLALLPPAALPTGEIPVWLAAPPEGTRLWGHRCAATQLNLLLGLLDFAPERHRPLIERAARAVLAQFLAEGLGAALYYGIPYTLWVGLAVVRRLAAQRKIGVAPELLDLARGFFAARLETAAGAEAPSPLDAAFYLLAAREAGLAAQPGWHATLLKQQQHDGGWPAEPLYLIPHRHGVGWYGSRLVTSAYCHLALGQ